MEKIKILEQVIATISRIAEINVEDIDGNSNLMDNLSLSSLEMISIVGELEEKYNVEIDYEDMSKFINVNDIVEFIDKKADEKIK